MMVNFDERLTYMLLGAVVGGVVGYIVRYLQEIHSKVEEVDRNTRQSKDESGFMRHPLVADVLYFLILLIVVFAAIKSQRAVNAVEDEDKSDKADLCVAGEDNREALRGITDAMFELATGIVREDDPKSPRTTDEIIRTNLYIDRVNSFREDTYDLIKPSEVCAPYVDDDNVEPPTPPFPHVTR